MRLHNELQRQGRLSALTWDEKACGPSHNLVWTAIAFSVFPLFLPLQSIFPSYYTQLTRLNTGVGVHERSKPLATKLRRGHWEILKTTSSSLLVGFFLLHRAPLMCPERVKITVERRTP